MWAWPEAFNHANAGFSLVVLRSTILSLLTWQAMFFASEFMLHGNVVMDIRVVRAIIYHYVS